MPSLEIDLGMLRYLARGDTVDMTRRTRPYLALRDSMQAELDRAVRDGTVRGTRSRAKKLLQHYGLIRFRSGMTLAEEIILAADERSPDDADLILGAIREAAEGVRAMIETAAP